MVCEAPHCSDHHDHDHDHDYGECKADQDTEDGFEHGKCDECGCSRVWHTPVQPRQAWLPRPATLNNRTAGAGQQELGLWRSELLRAVEKVDLTCATECPFPPADLLDSDTSISLEVEVFEQCQRKLLLPRVRAGVSSTKLPPAIVNLVVLYYAEERALSAKDWLPCALPNLSSKRPSRWLSAWRDFDRENPKLKAKAKGKDWLRKKATELKRVGLLTSLTFARALDGWPARDTGREFPEAFHSSVETVAAMLHERAADDGVWLFQLPGTHWSNDRLHALFFVVTCLRDAPGRVAVVVFHVCAEQVHTDY